MTLFPPFWLLACKQQLARLSLVVQPTLLFKHICLV